jgi:branched-chain amino acid transport system permease protein
MSGIFPSEVHEPPTERRTNRGRGLLIVFTAAMTIVAPLLLPMTAYYLNLLMQASTYAVAVVGLTIVLGYTGQINLAQAAFFGLGAYSVALGIVSLTFAFFCGLKIFCAILL